MIRKARVPVVPVFVLLDLNLPKVDGLDVLGRMTSDDRTRRIPVIVLTSSKHEEDLIGFVGLAADQVDGATVAVGVLEDQVGHGQPSTLRHGDRTL